MIDSEVDKALLYFKFPAILREALSGEVIKFPEETQFEYDSIQTYRAVERTPDDHTEISRNDFRSYAESGKEPKRARGVDLDCTLIPEWYGVSSYMNEEKVRQQLHFPNPHKKMAVGYVYQEGGPQLTRTTDTHVCWWLFENADVSGFKLKE